MTFLELCQQLRQEAGISGSGPVSVTGQSGINKKIVDWIKRAYAEIQSLHEDWRFLWKFQTFSTVPGKRTYTLEDLNADQFNHFDLDSFFAQRAGAQRWPLRFMQWEMFREFHRYERDGQPIQFTVLPDFAVQFDATPYEAEQVEYSFYRVPFVMTGNFDTPAWRENLHDIIVYKALMYYAADEEAPNIFQDAASNYRTRLADLERIYYRMPALDMGPLA